MVWREEVTWMNRRVSYGCPQLRLLWETQEDLDIASFFTFFSYLVHVIKLIFCLNKETQYAYGYSMQKNNTIKKKKIVQILPHVWVD